MSGVALSDTLAPAEYLPPPVTFTLFVAVSSPYAAMSSASVGNATSNVAVAISLTVPLVAVNVTVNVPSFVATPAIALLLSSYLRPAGSPETASFHPSAFMAATTAERSGAAPAASVYLSRSPAASNMGVVKFGTTRLNACVTGVFTFAFVALTVTKLTPGAFALPEIVRVFAVKVMPDGSPVTLTVGFDPVSIGRTSVNEPSASVVYEGSVLMDRPSNVQ